MRGKRRTVPQIEKDTEIKVLKHTLRNIKEQLKNLDYEWKEADKLYKSDEGTDVHSDIYNKMHGFKMMAHTLECRLKSLTGPCK